MGRLVLLAFVLATAWVQTWAALPPAGIAAAALGAAAVAAAVLARRTLVDAERGRPAGWPGRIAAILLAVALGISLACVRGQLRLADALSADNEGGSIPVVFRIVGLAQQDEPGQRAEVEILESRAGMPSRMALSWFAEPQRRRNLSLPPWIPGQRWSGYVVPKRPHGTLNPHGFDYEAWLFERGLRATGSLRGVPTLVDDDPFASPAVAVQRVRHHLRAAMREALGDARYGPVLIALALGDQAGVARNDWTVFNRTGITHLVSISGMHVTMLAALAALAVLRAWRLARWRGVPLAEYAPARIAAAWAALLAAFAYCLLAGWGVPAQRTFFMLAVLAVAAIARLPVSGTRVLALAAAAVVALDPWAAMAPGFWLSFGAVSVLMLAGGGRWRLGRAHTRLTRWLQSLLAAARLQLAITLGLIPLLALVFQQVSLVSPLANAIAIPVVGVVVTPLALLVMLLAAWPATAGLAALCGQLAHAIFAAMMAPIAAMADWPAASLSMPAVPWPWLLLAAVGVVWALQPRGVPARVLGVLLLVPMLAWRPARPAEGDWRLTVLDVGQGGAAVIETATDVVVFDAGPAYGDTADAGDRVIWPYLRARGIDRIDRLVISHGDLDHMGGLAALLAALPVGELRAPATMAGQIDDARPVDRPTPPLTPCEAGQRWEAGGVRFALLAPRPDMRAARDRNAGGCVLHVQGRSHGALFLGDVGVAQEAAIVAAEDWPGTVDAVLVGHHGSRTSSGGALVRAAAASHALIQAGYLNRYRHPHPTVVARWAASGAAVHRSDRDGGVTLTSVDGRLDVVRERVRQRRYWHAAEDDASPPGGPS